MKLLIEDDNGKQTEIKELPKANTEAKALIFLVDKAMTKDIAFQAGKLIEEYTGKKAIFVNNVSKVYGV